MVQIIYKNDWNNNNIDSNCSHGYNNEINMNSNNILDRGTITEIRREIVIAIKHSNMIDFLSNGSTNISAIIIIKINLKSR